MVAETLDLAALARILRRARLAIACAALAGALVAGGAALKLIKYRSDAVYTIGSIGLVEVRQPVPDSPAHYQLKLGIAPPDMKIEYPRLDGEHFAQFIHARGIAMNATLAKMVRVLDSPGTRADLLAPIYGTTRADLRELGEQTNPGESRVIALQISAYATDPAAAKSAANVLGEFVGESLFASQVDLLISRRHAQYQSQQLTYENQLLKSRFTIGAIGDKIAALQALKREFPNAGLTANRQVVSVADGGARYLSPDTQLVGMGATVADMRQDIATSERSADIARLLADYYAKAPQIALEHPASREMLAGFDKLIDASFYGASKDHEGAREARNEAMLDLFAIRALRRQGLRFASGPTEGSRDSTRIWTMAIAGLVLGALVMAMLAILRQALR